MADETEPISNVLEHFSEGEEALSLILSIPTICYELRHRETSLERWTIIMDKYQEQPHLLDPYIQEFVEELFKTIRRPDLPPLGFHHAFKYLYILSKVRGPKVIVRWFSHEVTNLEEALSLLEAQDMSDHETWETRYILLLWMSIIVIVPFELSRFDSAPGHESQTRSRPHIVDRILDIAKRYLCVPDKSRDAAALLAAKLVSRPDLKGEKLAEFIDWCLAIMNSTSTYTTFGSMKLAGMLSSLAILYKIGKRDDLIPFAAIILKHIKVTGLANEANLRLRKLSTKVAQRLGMVFLKPKLATWRYQRGSRSLAKNLNPETHLPESHDSHVTKDAEEGYDIPEETEQVIGLLLDGLKDQDTVVRWSAAKGVGRLTGRLPKELADEVVESVLRLCEKGSDDKAWHGSCLALAELGRRGLLLPQRLTQVVPYILKALVYDVKQGSCSVGSHVRDAACYVCWSFARAYDPQILASHVNQIASGLLITTVFDREINCRRAASAAFQEHVGRQGTFPHGIDILTTADYHAVGNRTTCFLEISVFIARYKEYTRALIDHLVECKVHHWDSEIRELTSEALHCLTSCDPEHMKSTILPQLLPLTVSPDLSTRHGAVVAVARLTHALYKHALELKCTLQEYLGGESLAGLKGVPGRLEEMRFIRGMGGEVMRPAILRYIQNMSLSAIPLLNGQDNKDILDKWQYIVDDNIGNPLEPVREAAVSTLVSLCQQYYTQDMNVLRQTKEVLVSQYIQELSKPNQFIRMGFALALGSLPKPLLCGLLKPVLASLAEIISFTQDPETKYTESRRDAVRALMRIFEEVDIAEDGDGQSSINGEGVTLICDSLFTAAKDYTTDNRGDIGASVREAVMETFASIIRKLAVHKSSLLTPKLVTMVIQVIIQQANEKIDRTRAIACEQLVELIQCKDPVIPYIPHHKELRETFITGNIDEMDWKVAQTTFPLTVPLISMETYSYHVLLGLIVSVGGLTESTVRHSSTCLLNHVKEISKDASKLSQFSDIIIDVFKYNEKDPRVIIPLFKTVDLLLSNGTFDLWKSETNRFPVALLECAKGEVTKCKDVRKLLSSVNVLCSLLQFADVKTKVLGQLMMFLCHLYPRVRRVTADQLYITLMTFDDIIEDETVSEQVTLILSEAVWEDPLDSVRQDRNKICDLLQIPKPVVKAKSGTKKQDRAVKAVDQMSSYRDLVDRAGY